MGVILEGTPIVTTPPTVINAPASNIGPSFATLAGEVTDPGGPVAMVTIFYGDDDAGSNALAWDDSLDLGEQGGVFSSVVTGLAPDTTHYFRVFASNAAGSDWADASASFTTAPPPDPPAVVNHPATGIGFTVATLGGEVTSTGGELPEVTISPRPAL